MKVRYHKCHARCRLVSWGQVSVIFKYSCNDIIIKEVKNISLFKWIFIGYYFS